MGVSVTFRTGFTAVSWQEDGLVTLRLRAVLLDVLTVNPSKDFATTTLLLNKTKELKKQFHVYFSYSEYTQEKKLQFQGNSWLQNHLWWKTSLTFGFALSVLQLFRGCWTETSRNKNAQPLFTNSFMLWTFCIVITKQKLPQPPCWRLPFTQWRYV